MDGNRFGRWDDTGWLHWKNEVGDGRGHHYFAMCFNVEERKHDSLNSPHGRALKQPYINQSFIDVRRNKASKVGKDVNGDWLD